MPCVDVTDPALTNEEQNEHTLLSFFKSLPDILRADSLLIPVDSSALEIEGWPAFPFVVL
jgi:hypothetical protein